MVEGVTVAEEDVLIADGGDVVVEDAGVDRVGALADVQDAVRPQTVKIDVQVISASTGDGGVDKRLEKLRDRLSEYKYSSYQLVSEQTVTSFRKGASRLRLESAEKIASAVEKIKRGLRISDFPSGSLGLDSGKWEVGERFPVSKITGGRRCGWCGEYHAERLNCYE